MSKSENPLILKTSEGVESAPLVSVRVRAEESRPVGSTLTGLGGWLLLVLSYYCFQHAMPAVHKIDGFFGVVRRRTWDLEMLAGAVALGALALLMAIAAVVMSYRHKDMKGFQPPLQSFALAALSFGSTVYFVVHFQ